MPDVEAIVGCDFVPPRRRLRRASSSASTPRDRDKLVAFVTEFAPDGRRALRRLRTGVADGPGARRRRARRRARSPRSAPRRAPARSSSVACGAASRCTAAVAVAPVTPDEDAPLDPTSPYGRALLEVEATAAGIARRHDVRVAALRLAPVVGLARPSPLGRLLRLPVVPVPAFADPPSRSSHRGRGAGRWSRRSCAAPDGPLNIVGPGAASPWQAVRLGGRIPLPVSGPGWLLARRLAEIAGAPIPPHTLSLMRHGLTADGGHAMSALGLGSMVPTQVVLDDLFEWATVTPISSAARRVA